jgi:hypothetical protein
MATSALAITHELDNAKLAAKELADGILSKMVFEPHTIERAEHPME